PRGKPPATLAKMAKLMAGKRGSPTPAWSPPCSTSDRPSHHHARDLARDGTDLAAEAPAGGGHLLGHPAAYFGDRALGVLAGLRDELLLLGFGPTHHLCHLALRLGLCLLHGGLAPLSQPVDLGLELSRRRDLPLRAHRPFLQQPERRIEPQALEGNPEHHEDKGLDGEAVVQLEHAERWAA